MTFKNNKVLKFYQKLPFNVYGDLSLAEDQIKKFDPLSVYPELKKIFKNYKKLKIIDYGCGGGWLVNSLAYHHGNKVDVTGVDFNSIVIKYANQIKKKLNLKSNFFSSDIFKFNDKKKYDLVVSLGVLHHTNNCHEAIKYICKSGNKSSFLFLGLYHKYGRKAFLDYFNNISHLPTEIKFNKYKELHKNITDEKKLYSWFRDQVLHPHETQHTFKEIAQLLIKEGYQILSCSLNKFKKIENLETIFSKEKDQYKYSVNKLKKKEYFPGFFITIAKKK